MRRPVASLWSYTSLAAEAPLVLSIGASYLSNKVFDTTAVIFTEEWGSWILNRFLAAIAFT